MLVSRNQKYAIASVALIMLSIIVDHAFFTRVQQVKNKPDDLQPIAQETREIPRVKSSSSAPMQSLSLTNINLPPPPQLQKSEPQARPQKTQVEQSIDQATSVAKKVPNSIDKQPMHHQAKQLKQIKQNRAAAQPTYTAHTVGHNPVNPSEAESKRQYVQLGQLNTGSLRLSFPDNYNASMRILNYMHQCVGIGLGAYEAQNGQTKLTLLSDKGVNSKKEYGAEQKYSKIVRFASGIQSSREQALIHAYAPNQQLVRLYPLWFDYALSEKIASVIGAQALSQFSGVYSLQGNTLYLERVSLNDKFIKGRWQLAHSVVCGA